MGTGDSASRITVGAQSLLLGRSQGLVPSTALSLAWHRAQIPWHELTPHSSDYSGSRLYQEMSKMGGTKIPFS